MTLAECPLGHVIGTLQELITLQRQQAATYPTVFVVVANGFRGTWRAGEPVGPNVTFEDALTDPILKSRFTTVDPFAEMGLLGPLMVLDALLTRASTIRPNLVLVRAQREQDGLGVWCCLNSRRVSTTAPDEIFLREAGYALSSLANPLSV